MTQKVTKKLDELSVDVKQRSMNEEPMKKGISEHLTAEQKAEIEALAVLPEDQIETDDMPEVRDWNGAKRGLFYRPVKQQITLRLDADIINWFRTNHPQGEGYQTSINRALREYIRQHHQLKH